MSIAEFIRETVLRPRLQQAGCLVVYDADKRYRDQCFELAGNNIRVVDASDSSIEKNPLLVVATLVCQQRTNPQGTVSSRRCTLQTPGAH